MTWQTKKLDDICDFISGLWTGKEPPFIKVGVIRNTNFTKDCKLDDSDIAYLNVETKQYLKRKLEYGDIIVEKSGGGPKQPVGRPIVFNKNDGDFSFSNFTSTLRVKNKSEVDFNFLQKYLFFQYQAGVTETMQSHSTGIRNLNFNLYKNIEVPLPPLLEQQRIVKILDETFESIDKVKSIAEKNLKNSKSFFESYLQSVFESSGDGWDNKNLGDKELFQIVDGDRGKNYPKKSDFSSDGYCLFLNTKNVRPNGFDFQSKMFISKKKDEEMGKGKLERNDVLLTTRGTIGNIAVYNEKVEFNNVRINSGMLIFRPNTKLIIPDYLFAIFQSGIMKSQIKKYFSGAAQPQLPIKTLVNFTFPVPKSKAIQGQIVDKLRELGTETKKLESIYQQKLVDLEELKKSILNKAFNGEL